MMNASVTASGPMNRALMRFGWRVGDTELMAGSVPESSRRNNGDAASGGY
jgi:hypothetical protein